MLLLLALPVAADARKQVTNSDPQLRLQGYEQQQEMKKNSPYKELKWQFLGPVNVSGRCTDVAVVAPKGKNYTIYAATASGGLWRTVNEATTWEPIFENAPSVAIGDVALAASDPDTIWIGTGEANIFRSSQAGCGVYKSNDGGKSWQHMGLTDTYTIPRIVIHPRDADTVYVAASGHEWTRNSERGVYKTIDGGKTWQKVLFIDSETGAIDLAMDPADSETLYAAVWQRTRLKWNDPRNGAAKRQKRHLPQPRRRQELAADRPGPAPGQVPRPHRHRRLPGRPECALRPGGQLRDLPPAHGRGTAQPVWRSFLRLHQGRHGLPFRRPRRLLEPGQRPDPGNETVHGTPLQHLRLGLRPDPRRSQ